METSKFFSRNFLAQIKKNTIAKFSLGLAFTGILLFQNCGPGFEVLTSGTQSASSQAEVEPSVTKFADGPHILLDDMVIPENVFRELRSTKSQISTSGHLPSTLKPWPNGIVPITIPRFVLRGERANNQVSFRIDRPLTAEETAQFRSVVQRACNAVSAVARVQCIIRESDQPQFIENELTAFVMAQDDNAVCSGPTFSCARIGGPGTADAAGNALVRPWMAIRESHARLSPGLVLHEFGHVLGLLHEHQRSDAGQYLLVSPALPENVRTNYLLLNSYVGMIPNATFDFSSMMIYAADGEVSRSFLSGASELAIRKEHWALGAQREMRFRGMHSGIVRPSIQDVSVLQGLYGAPESMVGKASCNLGSRVIPHGSFINVYETETTDANNYSTCEVKTRFCDNGVLSGTGDKLLCNNGCRENGTFVGYAYSKDFFEAATVPAGQTCRSQTRQCTAQGLSVPAGQQPFRFASCVVAGASPPPSPVPQNCRESSTTVFSDPNSLGMRNTCVISWPASMPSPVNRVSGTVTNGGTASAICRADGTYGDIQSTCPVPPSASPSPAPGETCPSGNESFMSAPNNVGNRTTCMANWGTASVSPNRISATVTNGGNLSAICSAGGIWTAVSRFCPAPADMATPSPSPSPSATPPSAGNNCVSSPTQLWTVGGLNCSAPGPAMNHNSTLELTNTISGIWGKATFRCVDGVRQVQAAPAATCALLSSITPIMSPELSAPTKVVLTADVGQVVTISQGQPPFNLSIVGSGDHVRFENGLTRLTTNSRTFGLVYRYTSVASMNYTVQVVDGNGLSTAKSVRVTVNADAAVSAVEHLECNVTKAVLNSYSMNGSIVPAPSHAGRDGRYYVAGYDPNEGAWWSFDGAQWTKHDGTDANFKAIAGITNLAAGGISGPVFLNTDLSAFPRGILYVGYGVGSSQSTSWNEMISARRYRICDVLPAN